MHKFLVLALTLTVAACSADNNPAAAAGPICGPGTLDRSGVCLPDNTGADPRLPGDPLAPGDDAQPGDNPAGDPVASGDDRQPADGLNPGDDSAPGDNAGPGDHDLPPSPVGGPCNLPGDCQTGLGCKVPFGETLKVCTPSPAHCTYREVGALVYLTSGGICAGQVALRCQSGQWLQSYCQGNTPVCNDGSCVLCVPDRSICTGPTASSTCAADGLSYTSGGSCFDFGAPICDPRLGQCSNRCRPGDVMGCAGIGRQAVCSAAGNYFDTVDCGAGLMCIGAGSCVDAPFETIYTPADSSYMYEPHLTLDESGPTRKVLVTFYDIANWNGNIHAILYDIDTLTNGGDTQIVQNARGQGLDAATSVANSLFISWGTETGGSRVLGQWFGLDGTALGSAFTVTSATKLPGAALVFAPNHAAVSWPYFTAALGRLYFTDGSTADLTPHHVGAGNGTPLLAKVGTDGFFAVWGENNSDVWGECFDKDGLATGALAVDTAAGQQWPYSATGVGGSYNSMITYGGLGAFTRGRTLSSACALGDPFDLDSASYVENHVYGWASGNFLYLYATDGLRAKILDNSGNVLAGPIQVTPHGQNLYGGFGAATFGTDSFVAVWTDGNSLYLQVFKNQLP
ncbi:MAG: hypothetical protein HY903_07480 [Deltaproteobacteria bacterium]|nr:hypothetical protein [Deltaproteobacteria bacterium]